MSESGTGGDRRPPTDERSGGGSPPFDAGERFELRRRLGEGGMGVVFEAFDRERRETVALKTLQRTKGHLIPHFKREFRALHDVAHRNLVGLGELLEGPDGPFFTMELVPGEDLLAHVRGGGGAPGVPCDVDRLRSSVGQLALGLTALHHAGMVHRDVKPTNVKVTPEGRVVLLDFGLVTETVQERQSTGDGIAGTVNYMAPEQAVMGYVSPASDWYSVGVILYEALTGQLPHTGRTKYECVLNKHNVRPPAPRELIAEVPEELDALCTGLLEKEPEQRPVPREIFGQLGVEAPMELSLPPSATSSEHALQAPFVGRQDELARLRAAHLAPAEGPRIVWIEGASGVGKSQLVREFLHRLGHEHPDTLILTGRCYEREVVSYKALDGIAESLARHLDHLAAEEVAELLPPRASLLPRLFPVLRRVQAIAAAWGEPGSPDPHEQRRRMFTALRELCSRLAQRQRMVWAIDDLQWTDADSLALLQELLAHEDALPVLLVATARPADTPGCAARFRRIQAMAPTEVLRLEDLPPEDARALAELLLPDRAPGALDALAAEAGGHPLFLHELARHLLTAQEDRATATFDEMLAARVGRLPPEARSLLEIVAVFGGPLTQEVAALAAGMSLADEARAARELHAAHLARTDGVHRTDRIVTYHDRVREHVAEQLDEERTQAIHEHLALELEQTGAAEHDPRTLVRHARAAGQHELTAQYASQAARRAAEALACNLAAEFYETALELGAYDEEGRRQLRLDYAEALVNAGRGPEAAAMYMAAAEGAEPAVRLRCQRKAADQWLITGHIQQGLETLQASLREIGEPFAATPRRALGRVLWNRMRLYLRGVGFQTRRESEVPLEELRRLDVLRATAHGLSMVDNIHGADFNGRFLLQALRTGETTRLVQALSSEVVFLASQGGASARRARVVYEALVRIVEAHPDNAYYRTWQLLTDGAASFFEGRFAAARAALDQAEVTIEDISGTTFERNNIRVWRVHALRQLGAMRKGAALIARSVRAGLQRGDLYLGTTLQLLQVQAQLAQDDAMAARENLAQLRWAPPEGGYHLQHWYELEARGELALYEGDAHRALAELEPSFEGLQRSMILRVNTVRAIAWGLRARMVLAAALQEGSPARARAEVERTARRLLRERSGYASLFATLLRAGLAASGPTPSPAAAVAHLREAVALGQATDMGLHLATARHCLGTRLGGDEGAALGAEAAAWAEREGVVRPDRLYRMVAPGCLPWRPGRPKSSPSPVAPRSSLQVPARP